MDLKGEFDDQGFVFVSGFCSQSQVGDILQNLDRVISDVVPDLPVEQVFYEDKTDPDTLKQIQLLHQHESLS